MRSLPVISATHGLPHEGGPVQAFDNDDGTLSTHWEPDAVEADMLAKGGTIEVRTKDRTAAPQVSVRPPFGYSE